MIAVNQRWRYRRDSYRPAGEVIATRRYEVAALAADNEAKRFVERHHYSASYPAARFRFGLFERGELVGVAVFSVPCRADVLTGLFGGELVESVELGRFVLLDRVPGNGETWFLARCFEQLRLDDLRGVLSFSDPMPRATAEGATVFGGHIGTIYQAHNARYLGQGARRTIRLLPDGRVFSARAISKIRAGERGWHHCAAVLEGFGASAPDPERRAEWLALWLPRLTRAVRHPGNHKYAWSFRRSVARLLPPPFAYPKEVPRG